MRRDLALQLGVKSFLKPDAVPTVDVANEAPKISQVPDIEELSQNRKYSMFNCD